MPPYQSLMIPGVSAPRFHALTAQPYARAPPPHLSPPPFYERYKKPWWSLTPSIYSELLTAETCEYLQPIVLLVRL